MNITFQVLHILCLNFFFTCALNSLPVIWNFYPNIRNMYIRKVMAKFNAIMEPILHVLKEPLQIYPPL